MLKLRKLLSRLLGGPNGSVNFWFAVRTIVGPAPYLALRVQMFLFPASWEG